jgi:uncharacterized protein (DUF302 family)
VKTRVIAALKEQGFGILSEFDVQSTLKQKIGQDIERYEILGACNPTLAYRALGVDRDIGLLLPCNVVLREGDGEVVVSIADPEAMFTLVSDETRRGLADLPGEATRRLRGALTALGGA